MTESPSDYISKLVTRLKDKTPAIVNFENLEQPRALDSKLNSPNTIGLYGEDLKPLDIINFAIETKLKHFIKRKNDSSDDEALRTIRIITDPNSLFARPISFLAGLEGRALSDQISERTMRFTIKSGKDKANLFKSIEDFVAKIPFANARLSDILLIADEFFSNALLHGHNDQNTEPKEITKITLAETEKVDFFITYNLNELTMGCEDSFGRMNIETILKKIQRCYELGASNSINLSKGGAGIGLWRVFRISKNFYLGVTPGRFSIVCSTIRCDRDWRKSGGIESLNLIQNSR